MPSILGNSAFKECEKLESVNISSTVTSLRDEAFRGCKSIKSVHLPGNVQYVGESTFRDCISMQKLVVDNGNIEIGERRCGDTAPRKGDKARKARHEGLQAVCAQ